MNTTTRTVLLFAILIACNMQVYGMDETSASAFEKEKTALAQRFAKHAQQIEIESNDAIHQDQMYVFNAVSSLPASIQGHFRDLITGRLHIFNKTRLQILNKETDLSINDRLERIRTKEELLWARLRLDIPKTPTKHSPFQNYKKCGTLLKSTA